jgi:hypothetical protein
MQEPFNRGSRPEQGLQAVVELPNFYADMGPKLSEWDRPTLVDSDGRYEKSKIGAESSAKAWEKKPHEFVSSHLYGNFSASVAAQYS